MFYWGHILYHLFTVTGYILYTHFTCIELDSLRSKMLFNDMNKMLEHVCKCSGKLAFDHSLAENIFREISNHATCILHFYLSQMQSIILSEVGGIVSKEN